MAAGQQHFAILLPRFLTQRCLALVIPILFPEQQGKRHKAAKLKADLLAQKGE